MRQSADDLDESSTARCRHGRIAQSRPELIGPDRGRFARCPTASLLTRCGYTDVTERHDVWGFEGAAARRVAPRKLADIDADLKQVEAEIAALLGEVTA